MELEVELDNSQNKTKNSHENVENDLKSVLGICAKIVAGEQPSDEDYEEISAVLMKYNIETGIRSSQSTVSLPACLFPPINIPATTRAPSSNSHARQNRRKRMGR